MIVNRQAVPEPLAKAFQAAAEAMLQDASFFSMSQAAHPEAASLKPGVYAVKDGDFQTFAGSASELLHVSRLWFNGKPIR